MQKTRVKLTGTDYKGLVDLGNKILDIAEKGGVKHSGLISLPTKKLVVPTRKSPSGGGTESFETWQMRIHKRLIDIESDERTLRRITRIDFPEEVQIEIKFKES